MDKIRLEFDSKFEFNLFLEFVKIDEIKKAYEVTKDEEFNVYLKFLKMLEKPKIIKYSSKKSKAAATATEARIEKVKEKINNAINILKLEGKKLNFHNIAKTAGVAYLTVRKYLTKEDLEKLNS